MDNLLIPTNVYYPGRRERTTVVRQCDSLFHRRRVAILAISAVHCCKVGFTVSLDAGCAFLDTDGLLFGSVDFLLGSIGVRIVALLLA